MKNTYTTPTVTTRGSVVLNTLSGKPLSNDEVGTIKRKPTGSNLTFGL